MVLMTAPLGADRHAMDRTLNGTLSVRLHEGRDAVLSAVDGAGAAVVSTAFQSLPWLSALFAELLPAASAQPILVEVRTSAGSLVLMLPLVATHERGLNVLRVPSFGVSDYGGPILGPAADSSADIWTAIKRALRPHDLLVVENMLLTISGRANPLATVPGIFSSEHHRNALTLPDTVDEFLRSLGKKYRKEVERCSRLLAERGEPEFKRAETPDDIAAAYAVIEQQQAARRHEAGGDYLLERPEYSSFYKSLLANGRNTGTAHIFTLAAGGEIGACLLGITNGGTFKLLRISTAGGDWKRISPGRLVVVEAMRHFVPRGVTRFDMGIGDYAFKQGFGIEPEPLVTLEVALTVKAWPRLALTRTRRSVRDIAPLRRAVRRLKGHSAD
jgi:CelD/BcsL family acetyltransferase involved in cellulose biosynthesis